MFQTRPFCCTEFGKAPFPGAFQQSFDEGIQETGCPLEDHPAWTLIYDGAGIGFTNLCWTDFGRAIEFLTADPPQPQMLNFRGLFGAGAVLEADYTPPSTGEDNWTLPFCKFVDPNNVVGARYNFEGGTLQLQVVQRVAGAWQTLVTTPVSGGGHWRVVITNSSIVIYVDGNLVFDQEHDINGDGYFGIFPHKWVAPDEIILTDYQGLTVQERVTPCMTGPTSPYGEASASIHLDNFVAWKGMNCSWNSYNDAWITPTDVDPVATPVWLQWFFPDAEPMVPTRFEVRPRPNMQTDWYNKNNPQHIKLFGLRQDGTPVELFDKQLNDWLDGSPRTWNIPWQEENFYGVRLQIVATNNSESTGLMHTSVSNFRCWGTPLDSSNVTYNGELVTVGGQPVKYRR